MIDTLLPDPAWQDEQMAAYVAARSSNDEASQKRILATVVQAFEPYLEFLSRSFAARLRSIDSLQAEDLVSVAKIALIEAMNRWDPKYGKELSRLASKYIRGYFLKAVERLSYGSVSVPGYLQRLVRKYRKLAEDGRSVEGEQLLKEKGLSANSQANVRRMVRQGIPRVCLNAPIGPESTQSAEEVIEDPASGRPTELADIREALAVLIEHLTPQEQLVLYLGCPSYVELPSRFEVRNRKG
jgi:RNA polymerase sigma factor (sigma-70 family)